MIASLQPAARIDVPTVLSPAEVRRYVETGFLPVPDLVDADELRELKTDLVKLARGGYPSAKLQAIPDLLSDAEVLRRILCIHQPHHLSPIMKKHAAHPRICGVLSQITAAHLPFWDGSVKCMQTMAFVKPPGFQGQAWHQDEIYIPTRDRSLVGAWIALDDATLDNGCLWVIPGSHQSGYLYPQRKHDRLDEWDFGHESYGFDSSTATPVPVEAGTVVFFNGYLLHASYRNRTETYRRVLVSHYMNAYSLLPWRHPKGATPTSQDDVRSIMSVAGVDPYAWKGTEQGSDVYVRQCAQSAALGSSAPLTAGGNEGEGPQTSAGRPFEARDWE
jgi:ectoine hydroxylase-related dioxygenase (phytanoyl-CoA dioxygenase family)